MRKTDLMIAFSKAKPGRDEEDEDEGYDEHVATLVRLLNGKPLTSEGAEELCEVIKGLVREAKEEAGEDD